MDQTARCPGASVDDILRDQLIAAHSALAVRKLASRLGVSLREADDLLTLPLSHDDRRQLAAAARRRNTTPAGLVCTVLRTVLHDDLLNAVLDDGR